MQVAVVGGGECSPEVWRTAQDLGRRLAEQGHVLICGGRGGVMEAACSGAMKAGGITVGILPGERDLANPYLKIIIDTGMGHARNAIVVKSSDVVVALPGEYGTLSEMALALKMGRRVINLGGWDLPGAERAKTVKEAIEMLAGSSIKSP